MGGENGILMMLAERQESIIRMNQQESEELEEGFYPQKPTIVDTPKTIYERISRQPDYRPNTLHSVPIHKILPHQVNEPFSHLQFDPPVAPVQAGGRLFPSISAYEQYEAKYSLYRLIYIKSQQQTRIFPHKYHTLAKRDVSIQVEGSRSRKTLKPYELPQEKVANSHPDDLSFDSRFECGNLFCVYRNTKQANTYHLLTQKDTNSLGYNQWFYFSLQNVKADVTYTFHFSNLRKRNSLHQHGVQLVIFSMEEHKRKGSGWSRRGRVLSYGQSNIHDMKNGEKMPLYCLVVEITFPHSQDWVTLSSGLPYSYTRLINQLSSFKDIALRQQVSFKLKTITQSLSQNQVPYVTLGEKQIDKSRSSNDRFRKKNVPKVIVILARQHPAQTHSSFIAEQIIRQLCMNESASTRWLLDYYEFRIFPMVNVDGVIYGNSRCDLVGFDLNRNWRWPVKQILPQITTIKEEIQSLNKERRVEVCIDLHSHSTMFNMFAYCCQDHALQARVLPFLISQQCKTFNFPSCTYGLTFDKQATARGVLSKIAKKATVLTLESSYYGSRISGQKRPFGPEEFEEMGKGIIVSLRQFLKKDKESKSLVQDLETNLEKYIEMAKLDDSAASGSDSEPDKDTQLLDSRLGRLMNEQLAGKVKDKIQSLSKEEEHQAQSYLTPNLNIEVKPPLRDLSLPRRPPIQRDNPIRRHSMLSKQQKRSMVGNFKYDKKLVMNTPQGSHGNWMQRRRNRIQTECEVQNILILPNQHSPIQESFRLKDGSPQPTDNTFKMLYKELTHRKRQNSHQYQTISSSKVDQFTNEQISMTMRREAGEATVDFKPSRQYSKFERILKVRRKKGVFRTQGVEETIDYQPEQDYKLLRIKSEAPQFSEMDLRAAKIKDLLQRDTNKSQFSRQLTKFQPQKDCKVSLVQRIMREKLTVFQTQRRKR